MASAISCTESMPFDGSCRLCAPSLASAPDEITLRAHNLDSAVMPHNHCKVEQIPLRRAWGTNGLEEKLVLPKALAPRIGTALLQVKHTLLDFSRLLRNHDIVPGSGTIGKIVSIEQQELLAHTAVADQKQPAAKKSLKYYVFPYSACWVQRATPCANCREVLRADVTDYDVHRRWPCLRLWHYGETIDGGFQTYMQVLSPEHILVEIPKHISLHDVCFLDRVAVPFYGYCVDVLANAIALAPAARILVILQDAEREANDCLLVRHHLGYEHVRMTFTDTRRLAATPELRQSYRGRFEHILVFASNPEAIEIAVELGAPATHPEEMHTLALFSGAAPAPELTDRSVFHVRPSYKDKFLLEGLLSTLSTFNHGESTPLVGSRDSNASDQNFHDDTQAQMDDAFDLNKLTGDMHRKGHVSWLYCDKDLRLCTDDACNMGSCCQLTTSVNDMVYSNCGLRRVFYTHRLSCSSKINALML